MARTALALGSRGPRSRSRRLTAPSTLAGDTTARAVAAAMGPPELGRAAGAYVDVVKPAPYSEMPQGRANDGADALIVTERTAVGVLNLAPRLAGRTDVPDLDSLRHESLAFSRCPA